MLSVIIVIYTYYKRKERIINSIESLRDLNSHLMYLSYILVAAISPLGRTSILHYVNVGKAICALVMLRSACESATYRAKISNLQLVSGSGGVWLTIIGGRL